MIHPNTELKYLGGDKGFCVVATKDIKRGTIMWVKDDLDIIIPKNDITSHINKFGRTIENYIFVEPNGDAVLCWDIAKYINHSNSSNVLTTTMDFEIAVRDIKSGEEINNDYRYYNFIYPNSEEYINFNVDRLTLITYWDTLIKYALNEYSTVKQELLGMLDSEQLDYLVNKTYLKDSLSTILINEDSKNQ